jgi:hypothetical protein
MVHVVSLGSFTHDNRFLFWLLSRHSVSQETSSHPFQVVALRKNGIITFARRASIDGIFFGYRWHSPREYIAAKTTPLLQRILGYGRVMATAERHSSKNDEHEC